MKTEKYCKRCDQTLPIESFTVAASRYDGVQQYCQECMKLYRKEHYNNNKDAYHKRARVAEAKLKEVVLAYKANPCMDCGTSFPGEPWLLEFDHRDASEKVNIINFFIKNGNRSKLEEEVAKCDLVCVMCHRRRTAKRGGWVDNRLAHVLD